MWRVARVVVAAVVIARRGIRGPGRMRPAEIIRRAAAADEVLVLVLAGEFCMIDRHRFDRERVLRGLRPLLAGDRFGQAWLIGPLCGPPIGYAVVTWSWSPESGGGDCILASITCVIAARALEPGLCRRSWRPRAAGALRWENGRPTIANTQRARCA